VERHIDYSSGKDKEKLSEDNEKCNIKNYDVKMSTDIGGSIFRYGFIKA